MFFPRKGKRNAKNVAAAGKEEKVDPLVVEMQERKKNPAEVIQADPVDVVAKGRKKRKQKKKAENVNVEAMAAAVMTVAPTRAELMVVMREETKAAAVMILVVVTPGQAKAENHAIRSLERRQGPPLR